MRKSALAIGNFDGLHRGHQRVIFELKKIAKKENLQAVVLTFSPHPFSSQLLISEEGKEELFKKWNIEMYTLNPESIFHLSAEEFVKDILVKKINAKYVVVGKNFRFGHQKKGDVSVLKRLGRKYNFQVKAVPLLKNKDKVISSGSIRKLLKKGKMEEVKNLLGRPYEIVGKVISGAGRGKKLGFPTANLQVNSGLFLPKGVFIAQVLENGYLPACQQDESPGRHRSGVYQGIVNIGAQPTFLTVGEAGYPQNLKTKVEVHLFSYQGNLYHKKLKLSLLKKIRDEKKFSSPAILKKQIERDILQTKNFFLREE